jgi:predicted acetyltransferase
VPIRSLASLIAGHNSATELRRAGLLDAKDDGALRLADRLFATEYPPYCPDGF